LELKGARGLWKLTARESRFSELTDRFGSAHRVERAGDELCRTRSIQVVSGLCLEQFGVRQDDSELVVQSVKQYPQVRIESRTISGAARLRAARV
jgi:hypothetical protein